LFFTTFTLEILIAVGLFAIFHHLQTGAMWAFDFYYYFTHNRKGNCFSYPFIVVIHFTSPPKISWIVRQYKKANSNFEAIWG
jgi:hypothetical protein